MGYDPEKHHRRSIRLKNYDYRQPGWYFITICTFQQERRFGEISQGKMLLNPAGEAVQAIWRGLGKRYPNCNPDAFIAMPDHVHGLLQIVSRDVEAKKRARLNSGQSELDVSALGHIVNGFKSLCARDINRIENSKGRKLWHRNYYESILKEGDGLMTIRQYIWDNPRRAGQSGNLLSERD